jgi:hypothetical protein
VLKLNSALAPFRVPGSDIFGNKNNLRGPANEPIFLGVGLRRDEREHRGTIGRSDCNPPVTGLKLGIESQIEAKLVHVKSQASFLIFNENIHRVNAEVWVLSIQMGVRAAHSSDYSGADDRFVSSASSP